MKTCPSCGGEYSRVSTHISMSNERENTSKVQNMFNEAGIKVSNFNIQKTERSIVCDAQLTVDESKKMWEYMGDPLPGFEYKWPEDT